MRQLPIGIAAILALMSTASGCSAGRDFTRPKDQELVLDKTTLSEILERYGRPTAEQERVVKSRRVKTLKYYYAQSAMGWTRTSISERSLALDFFEDRLAGYIFHSSFELDHTNFDDSKVDLIKKGQTSVESVLQWLGEPHGRVSPAIRDENDHALLYAYFEKHKSGNQAVMHAMKVLLVTYGADGIVTDVKFNKSESK